MVNRARIVERRRQAPPDGAPFTYVDEQGTAEEVTPIGVVADPRLGVSDDEPSPCSVHEFRVDDLKVEKEALEMIEQRRRELRDIAAACAIPWMREER